MKTIGKLILLLVLTTPLIVGAFSANAATEEEIEASIESGLAWLAAQQDEVDGSWPAPTATTCFAVLKFEDRGWELFPPPGDGPFEPGYVYGPQVEAGLDYLFSQVQESGGLVFVPGHWVYETGICMMAVAASREPGRIVTAPGAVTDWTYEAVLQGMLDWMEDAQSDGGCAIGGWGYSPNDERVDNSVTGYATLGIGYAISPAYGFGLTVDPIVLAKLDTFVSNIQHPVSGGSGYELWEWQDPCESDPGNILRTGNLLYEMALVGRLPDDPTVQAAIGFIEDNWPGWIGSAQAAFTMMKGLEAYQIDTLTVGMVEIDWFDEVSTWIVDEQNLDGSWPPTLWGDSLLATEWNLLTLEKVVPLIVIEVDIDIKPGSDPNSINPKGRGNIPVAILSTPFFDAPSEVDKASLTFGHTGDEDSLAFCNPSPEDVNGDGLLDQVCHFNTQDTGFQCGDTEGILWGQTVDGVPIQGSDSVRIVPCR